MNILIISLDKGLLGQGQLGDVVERHREYGRHVSSIDIIVFSKTGYSPYDISENVHSFPTDSSSRLHYAKDALHVARVLYKEKRYDLIVTQDPFVTAWVGMKLKKKYGSKLLVHFHGDFFDNNSFLKEGWENYLLLRMAKRSLKKADAFRVMSEGIKIKLLQRGVEEKKIRVIPTPVQIEKFEKFDSVQIESIKKTYEMKKVILFTGRLETVKDIPTLLAAYEIAKKQFENCVLMLIGNGSEEERLKNMCLEKNLEVYFLGQMDQDQIIQYYHACEIVVLSSLSESFGKVLVEANACSKPVVATATTGAKEIVEDGINGFLIPIGDYVLLSETMLKLLKNPDMAKKMGEKGKTMAYERFNGKENVEKIVAFWKDLAKKPYEFIFERQEVKFLLSLEKADDFIREVSKHTEFDDYSKKTRDHFYGISNLYFDTKDFSAFTMQKNKGEWHVKYRLRVYEYPISDETLVFPEIKRKGSFVGKVRCSSAFGEFMKIMDRDREALEKLSDDQKKIIKEFLENAYSQKIEPKAIVIYKRCALISSDENKLRITVDKDFKAKKYENLFNRDGAIEILPAKCIIEVKFKNCIPDWLKEAIGAFRLEEYHGSKYCTSVEKCYNIK